MPALAALFSPRDGETTLDEIEFAWNLEGTYRLSLEAKGNRLRAWIDDALIFDVRDDERPLAGGAMALLCKEGPLAVGPVRVQPA